MITTPTNEPWVVCPKPNPRAVLRLFCFPYAGGGASAFRTWPEGLPLNVEVYAVQPPGRESRLKEPLFDRLLPLVDALAQALRPYMNMPFAFFGHSLGTLMSFELARKLRRQNAPGPLHLFVAGRCAPQILDPDPPVHELPEPEFVEELRRLNGTPEPVLQHPELMTLLLPTLRADFAINETYVYQDEEPLDCPISAFGGLEDQEVSRDDLAAWRVHTRGNFRLQVFPGGHFFLHTARSLLLQTLSLELVQTLHRLAPVQRL